MPETDDESCCGFKNDTPTDATAYVYDSALLVVKYHETLCKANGGMGSNYCSTGSITPNRVYFYEGTGDTELAHLNSSLQPNQVAELKRSVEGFYSIHVGSLI